MENERKRKAKESPTITHLMNAYREELSKDESMPGTPKPVRIEEKQRLLLELDQYNKSRLIKHFYRILYLIQDEEFILLKLGVSMLLILVHLVAIIQPLLFSYNDVYTTKNDLIKVMNPYLPIITTSIAVIIAIVLSPFLYSISSAFLFCSALFKLGYLIFYHSRANFFINMTTAYYIHSHMVLYISSIVLELAFMLVIIIQHHQNESKDRYQKLFN
mmetsp:Transcript_1119/g.1726  ORF Transcript_1119/g.1726 Transcript_1119/m.1726 type:complete len:217 (+) Transcript_1119:49-699(+)